jgi:hypothetical protein
VKIGGVHPSSTWIRSAIQICMYKIYGKNDFVKFSQNGSLPVGFERDLDACLSSKSRNLAKPLPVHMKALKCRLM